MDFTEIDMFLTEVDKSRYAAIAHDKSGGYKLGVDLGTAYTVLVALDARGNPAACEMEYADVVRDGLVLDFNGARKIVSRLKDKIERRLNAKLRTAAIAVPPGTGERDQGTHRYVCEGAGLDVTAVLNEPEAANAVLRITDGAVVDIGGGTTGLSVFSGGKMVYTADEPTGGTHMTLVIAGNRRIPYNEAETYKCEASNSAEVFSLVTPVISKIGTIINKHIRGYNPGRLVLVGGACKIAGMEAIIEQETGIAVYKPNNPLLVTPAGIAMNCI